MDGISDAEPLFLWVFGIFFGNDEDVFIIENLPFYEEPLALVKGQFLLDDAVDDSRVVKIAGFDQIQRIRVQMAGRCRFIMDDAADTDVLPDGKNAGR